MVDTNERDEAWTVLAERLDCEPTRVDVLDAISRLQRERDTLQGWRDAAKPALDAALAGWARATDRVVVLSLTVCGLGMLTLGMQVAIQAVVAYRGN